ncbi:hypothetical protein HMPREF1577_00868 [Gardnerella pickettii JCP8017A]|uniref:Uncharacterized protein n=1 Tax=Gardnerella pickettii JCP8017A TaxID=1261062 RepID=T2PKE1_9BIFI|nr:hypothetical protein HMPREF1577_00868 [Gardnerella pickettii JCP8017A]
MRAMHFLASAASYQTLFHAFRRWRLSPFCIASRSHLSVTRSSVMRNHGSAARELM